MFVLLSLFVTLSILHRSHCQITEINSNYPSVTTPLGIIEGAYAKSVKGRTYSAFEGIPYGKPPVGLHRFEDPQPIDSWKGIWVARTKTSCLQYYHSTEPGKYFVTGEEDCLYVNVYAPKIKHEAPLDVIIFIHGGAFMFNSGNTYGPKFIMDRDVIFVTFNYRLGPLGFISTEDDILPGNIGMRDQIAALKWIKDNIIHFGGNSNSITIVGMSAGGVSVQMHYLSPLSKGLFTRGFSQSGVVLNPWVLVENSLEKAKQLAAAVGCPNSNSKIIKDCLRTRPGVQIVEAVKLFQPWLYNPFSPFGVVIDKWSANPVLPEHPYLLLKNKKLQDLPWIASNVDAEGLYPAADFAFGNKYLEEINTRWDELMPFICDYNNTASTESKNKISKRIRYEYMQGDDLDRSTFTKFVKIISDRLFLHEIEKAIKLQASAMSSPVYYYYFSYRGAHSKSELRTHTDENFGASHGDDTVYVLSTPVDTQSTPSDREMSEVLLDVWISFAKDSLPPKLPNNLEWPRVSLKATEPFKYLHIKSPKDMEILKFENIGNVDFWDSLPLKENEKLFVTKDEL